MDFTRHTCGFMILNPLGTSSERFLFIYTRISGFQTVHVASSLLFFSIAWIYFSFVIIAFFIQIDLHFDLGINPRVMEM